MGFRSMLEIGWGVPDSSNSHYCYSFIIENLKVIYNEPFWEQSPTQFFGTFNFFHSSPCSLHIVFISD